MKKILVVDDDADILFMLKKFLTVNHFDTRVSKSCQEGLALLAEFQPHLVVSDINVAGEDGRELCQSIKSQTAFQHIPVIMISANPQWLNSCKSFGADHMVEKPFELTRLLTLIRQLMPHD